MDPEYQKRLREIRAWEQERDERAKRERPYQAGRMNSERMPLGCWIWVIGAVALVLWIIKKYWLGI